MRMTGTPSALRHADLEKWQRTQCLAFTRWMNTHVRPLHS
jgi:hypothetical protein